MNMNMNMNMNRVRVTRQMIVLISDVFRILLNTFDESFSTLFIVSESDFGYASALIHRCELMKIPATRFDRVTSEL